MSELHRNTIMPAMRNIMTVFSKDPLAGEFYLAGGTALALQLGHRLSVDLDFFSPTQSDIPAMLEPLRYALRDFSPVLSDSSWGNLVFLADNVRVGFYGYGYSLVAPLVETEIGRLASVADIALMKMDALPAYEAKQSPLSSRECFVWHRSLVRHPFQALGKSLDGRDHARHRRHLH
jgi:hypothetical protein